MKEKLPKKRKKRVDKGVKRGAYKKSADSIYRSCVARANSMKVSVNITPEEAERVTSAPCAYCGATSGYIELIEPSDGFTEGNCVPACSICHKIRKAVSHSDVDKVLKRSAKNLGSQNVPAAWRGYGDDLDD